MDKVDKASLQRTVALTALHTPVTTINVLRCNSETKQLLLRRRGVPNVVPVPRGGEKEKQNDEEDDQAGDDQFRLVLLEESVPLDLSTLSDAARELLSSCGSSPVKYEINVGYDQMTAVEALRCLLPDGVECPNSFETIGHIAHLNLSNEQRAHGKLIGSVLLDKVHSLKTVISKSAPLNNKFRNLDFDLLAGVPDYVGTVTENGLRFTVDFEKVFWNSRLVSERAKLSELISPGATVLDLMAGVGAFAMYLGKRGCRVLANDLNVDASDLIKRNAIQNKLTDKIAAFNMDAREFVLHAAADVGVFFSSNDPPPPSSPSSLSDKRDEEGATCVHCVLNLPEIAIEFLDVFVGLFTLLRENSDEQQRQQHVSLLIPFVHCYCFARGGAAVEEEIKPRVEAALGLWPPGVSIREVRGVAPTKKMYCVEFRVPNEILDRPLADRGAAQASDNRKRVCCHASVVEKPAKVLRKDNDDKLPN